MTPMKISPLGDSALVVRVRERFDDAPEETLDEVLRAFQRIRNAAIPGVIELAPAYTSVAVFFDPITVAKATETPGELFDLFVERIRAAVAADADRGRIAAELHDSVDAWSKSQSAMIRSSHSTSMMLRDARISCQAKSSVFTALLSIASPASDLFPDFHFWLVFRRNWPRRAGRFRGKKFHPVLSALVARKPEFIRCVRPAAGTSSVARHCACSVPKKIRPHFCARANACASAKSRAMNLNR